MGHGEIDLSVENKKYQQPSLNTTQRLLQDKGDFIMHIGDLSYAEGYGASVSAPLALLWEYLMLKVTILLM